MRCTGNALIGCVPNRWLDFTERVFFQSAIYSLILFAVLLGTAEEGHAQSSHSGLIDQISKISSDSVKYEKVFRYEETRSTPITPDYLNLLERTIDFYIETGHPEASFQLTNSVLEYYTFGDNPDQKMARKIMDKMDPHMENVPFDSTLIHFLVLSGEVNVYTNRPGEAIGNFKTIIDKCRESGDTTGTNFGYAHLKLAEIFSSQWNIVQSDKYFRRAADFFYKRKDTTMYLWSLSGQVTLLNNNGLYHEAEEISRKIFREGKASERLQVVVAAHLSAALSYKDRKMPDLEYNHMAEARKYMDFPSEVRDYLNAIIYSFLTQYFSDRGDIDSTDYCYNQFLEFYKPDKHGSWFQEYLQIARACQAKVHKDYIQAENITTELIDDVRSTTKLNKLTRLYQFLVDIYNEAGDKSRAFEALVEFNHLQDSLQGIQVNNQFLYYNQLFEAEKKDKQIVQQEASIQLLSARNKLMFWRGLGVLFTISGLFLIIYLIRSYRFSRQKTQLHHEFSQNLIQEQENERLRISQDLHDGISQDLILIKNKLDMIQKPEVADMVSETLNQLRQVSRSLYPVTLINFGLKAALEEVLKKIDIALPDVEVYYDIMNCGGVFSTQQELHIYRIVQEATTNILKYADCSRMKVTFQQVSEGYHLTINDDGKGMDFDSGKFHKGVGMNSMKERAKILGGKLTVKSEKDHGTHISVKIPANE